MVLKLIRIDYLVGLEHIRNTFWVIENLQTAKRDNIRRENSAKNQISHWPFPCQNIAQIVRNH